MPKALGCCFSMVRGSLRDLPRRAPLRWTHLRERRGPTGAEVGGGAGLLSGCSRSGRFGAKRLVLVHVDREGTGGKMMGGRHPPQREADRFDWQPVFEHRAAEESARRLWAARPTQARARLESAGPTLGVVKRVLERAKDSASSPDGGPRRTPIPRLASCGG